MWSGPRVGGVDRTDVGPRKQRLALFSCSQAEEYRKEEKTLCSRPQRPPSCSPEEKLFIQYGVLLLSPPHIFLHHWDWDEQVVFVRHNDPVMEQARSLSEIYYPYISPKAASKMQFLLTFFVFKYMTHMNKRHMEIFQGSLPLSILYQSWWYLWFTFLRPIENIPCNTVNICWWLVKELRPYLHLDSMFKFVRI